MGYLEYTQQDGGQTQSYGANNSSNYQFTSLEQVINQFIVAYVGEGKTISKVKRVDVAFHAQRALQELSFDTLKSTKAQEITLPPSLMMELPQDYINYTKVSWVDSAGIKHPLYPTSKTSNPQSFQSTVDGQFLYNIDGNRILSGELIKNGSFDGNYDEWELNYQNFDNGQTNSLSTQTNPSANYLGDPFQGYFLGNNAIEAYNTAQFAGITQQGIPVVSGEKYTITFTLSGYTGGEWIFILVDPDGNSSTTTPRTANGTYTETITAGVTPGGYSPANSIIFRNNTVITTTYSNANVTLDVVLDNVSLVRFGDEETSTTWGNYKSGTPSENQDDYIDDTYWPMSGSRYGLDPQHAQANGSFYVDETMQHLHFSSNVSGKTVILDYISDGLGTDDEMQVHKFAEEAIYKCIAYAILSTRANVQEYIVQRYKKERFAAIRTAKLRLSNLKLEELTQILRGKSKQIKH